MVEIPRELEEDLKKAMNLLRNMRYECNQQRINPVAFRIALKFALHVDDRYARQHLNIQEEIKIEEIALALFEQTAAES